MNDIDTVLFGWRLFVDKFSQIVVFGIVFRIPDILLHHVCEKRCRIQRSKKVRQNLLSDLSKANLAVRNFPLSVDELRKSLKINEGGETYLFATTLKNGEKVLIRTKKAAS